MRKLILILSFIGLSSYCLAQDYSSTNNDKYWFSRYAIAEQSEDSYEWRYPQNEDSMFEVEFRHAVNPEATSFPIAIYLNEIKDSQKVSSKLITHVYKTSGNAWYELKADSVGLFSGTHHIVVTSDGTILIMSTKNGKYVLPNMIFQPSEAVKPLYSIRYDVLRKKVMNL